ncbi:uncharacterized protein [Prorops nasuta]|uniref:uncharacterized protein n=1 Tax=Prorops nasuta TaxID=863751 RepID=UPI0034CE39A7
MSNLKKTLKIVYEDGFCYYKNVKKIDKAGNEITYLKCKRRDCSGSAKIMNNKLSAVRVHNHAKESKYVKTAKFREELVDFVKKTPISLKEAYNYKMKENIEACAIVTLKSIRSTLKRSRIQSMPYNPKTLKDIRLIVNNEVWQDAMQFMINDDKHIISVHVQEINAEFQVFLYDKNFLQKMNKTVDFSVDATYYSRPKLTDVYQLLTIMGRVDDKFLPCLWVLMSRKTEQHYIEVFKFLKESVLKDFNVNSFMTDFELGLRNAIKVVYSNCKLKSCFFHYVHDVRKYANKLRLFRALEIQKIEIRIKGIFLLRKMQNLPLLPASSIEIGYAIIKENLNANKELLAIPQFRKLFVYINNFWLKKIGVHTLSVYQMDVKTNNNQERYHRSLNDLMKHRPTFYKFLLKLKDLIMTNVTELSQMRNHLNIKNSNKKRSDRNFDKWLRRGWKTLEELEGFNGNIKRHKVDEFLYTSVYKNENLLKKIKRILINRGK